MNSNTANYIPRIGIWVLMSLLAAVNVLRILQIPATYDEVTFFTQFHHSYADILSFKAIVSANVHPLNFIVTKFFTETFSGNIFFLRLGTLLAQIIYLVYTRKLVMHLFANGWWQLGAFLLLQCNPFLFDFWALNRGYGMAIAFMAVSIYHLYRFATGERELKHLAIGLVASALACYSNFALLHYYIGSLAAVGIFMLPAIKAMRKKFLLSAIVVTTAITGALYAIVRGPIQILTDAKQLYHGGTKGFYSDTVRTLVKECLMVTDVEAMAVTICSVLAVAITVANGLYLLIYLLRNKMTASLRLNGFFWLVMAGVVASVMVQFYHNNTILPTDRTALFFYVLFMLTLCSWLYAMMPAHSHFTVMSLLMGLLSILFLGHFVARLSLRSTWQWSSDRHNVTILERIKKSYKGHKIHFRPAWFFEPSMNYYIHTRYSQYFHTIPGIGFGINPNDTSCDYYYIPTSERKEIPGGYIEDTIFTVENTNAYGGKYVLLKKASL